MFAGKYNIKNISQARRKKKSIMNIQSDNKHLTNPFIFLGKYLRRQEENYLTLCICFLINSSTTFRFQFIRLLSSLSLKFSNKRKQISLDSLVAIPQFPFNKAKGKRGFFDIAILTKQEDGSPNRLLAVIEVKVEALFGPNQLLKYRKYHRNVNLFVLTKYLTYESSIGFNKTAIPRFRWFDVYDALNAAHHSARSTEKYLLKEGVDMLTNKGLDSPDSITLNTWKYLDKPLENTTRLRKNASQIFRGLAIILDRLVLFRNSSWSKLEEEGWKPFINYKKNFQKETGNYHLFEAGYYKYKKGAKQFRQKGICIQLYKDEKVYKQFVLFLSRYRINVKTGFDEYEKPFRSDTSRKCFTLPFPDALALIEKDMSTFLKAFRRSNDSKTPK